MSAILNTSFSVLLNHCVILLDCFSEKEKKKKGVKIEGK